MRNGKKLGQKLRVLYGEEPREVDKNFYDTVYTGEYLLNGLKAGDVIQFADQHKGQSKYLDRIYPVGQVVTLGDYDGVPVSHGEYNGYGSSYYILERN